MKNLSPEDRHYEISFLHVQHVHFAKAQIAMDHARKAFEDGLLMVARLKTAEAAMELETAQKLMSEWYQNTRCKPLSDEELEDRRVQMLYESKNDGGCL